MSIKTLPSMEHTFTINIKGSETAQQFDGTFTYKRPNQRMKSEIAKTTARLNEELKGLDEDTLLVHRILASLRHTLIKSPEWWQKSDFGYELYDVNVIFEIFKACTNFENEWFEKVWGGDEKKEEAKKEEK